MASRDSLLELIHCHHCHDIYLGFYSWSWSYEYTAKYFLNFATKMKFKKKGDINWWFFSSFNYSYSLERGIRADTNVARAWGSRRLHLCAIWTQSTVAVCCNMNAIDRCCMLQYERNRPLLYVAMWTQSTVAVCCNMNTIDRCCMLQYERNLPLLYAAIWTQSVVGVCCNSMT